MGKVINSRAAATALSHGSVFSLGKYQWLVRRTCAAQDMSDKNNVIADIMVGLIPALDMRGAIDDERNIPYSRSMPDAIETIGRRRAEAPRQCGLFGIQDIDGEIRRSEKGRQTR